MTKKPRVPSCKGYRIDTTDYTEYDCEYGGQVDCDYCAAGFWTRGGTISPISGKEMPSLVRYKETDEYKKFMEVER